MIIKDYNKKSIEELENIYRTRNMEYLIEDGKIKDAIKRLPDNNCIEVLGELINDFNFHHEYNGGKFYTSNLKINRKSDNCDIVPIIVSDRLGINIFEIKKGMFLEIFGELRTCILKNNDKKLSLSIFALKVNISQQGSKNKIKLNGYICKKPTFRKTPLGKEISDIMLAINRQYNKSDYIPCIVWGKNARYISQFDVGTKVQIKGRLQSREYIKKIDENLSKMLMVYEVSANGMEVLNNEN